MRNRRVDVCVTDLGVQIVKPNEDEPFLEKRYEPGDPLWDFLTSFARTEFGHRPEVLGKQLVAVDMHWYDSQFSFK